jgi:hypothetical protein
VIGALCLAASLAWAAPPPAAKPLAIVRATLHQGGEDQPPIPASYEYVGGEALYLSYRVSGYTVNKDGLVQVRSRIMGLDPDGVMLFDPVTDTVEVEMSPNDKDWMPVVRRTLSLPSLLSPGEYLLRLYVADEYGKSNVEQTVRFKVQGRVVPRSETLVIRGFGLFASESAHTPLDPPVHKPGGPLLARFVLTGYKLGEKNKFEVAYGIRILRPDGSTLFDQPDAAQESDSPFYPKRWLEGGLSLNSNPDTPAGEYTLVVTARDMVGNQTAEEKFRFLIR